ncbi:MAG: hypothetical protein HYW49_05845 [Deltaproteobacteria bacterium]|nr:hypothetical protein [Deltaproteobacteria bacterium]
MALHRKKAPRFGIGEWFGQSFVRMNVETRKNFANQALKHNITKDTRALCPFKMPTGRKCTKKGGVCSLRPYRETTDGAAEPILGELGGLVAVCPHRFKQDDVANRKVGQVLLGTENPKTVYEVRFLQRKRVPIVGEKTEENEERAEEAKEDVGNIDCVLLHPDAEPMHWCALEIQAVYFSGKAMTGLFRHILQFSGDKIPFPEKARRPDYRSSGPKRLMPQLQIKVPTLRRWGKKMAVVVDRAFYRSLGRMETVSNISNCDIAWFVIDYNESTNPVTLVVSEPEKQTLERAVEGLTGGTPVTLPEFERKITEKLLASTSHGR